MNKAQAQIELTKVNTAIENKIVEHKNELGQYNKSIVEGELESLWAKKNILVSFINS